MEVEYETPKPTPRREREQPTFLLSNPGRVIPVQVPLMSLLEGQRYEPVGRQRLVTGILLLRDMDPDAPQDVTKGVCGCGCDAVCGIS